LRAFDDALFHRNLGNADVSRRTERRQVSIRALAPASRPGYKSRMKLATLIGAVRTALAAAVVLSATAAWADDASEIIKRLGRPDRDDSTEYDQPRPPVVTRWLDYTRQNVRVMLVPTNKVGDPPPYSWKLMGFMDLARQQKLSPEEVARRFGGR
jgi:hypothetical protein